jgi:hypothetical protein
MDESGYSDWADTRPEAVHIPAEFDANLLLIPFNRSGK